MEKQLDSFDKFGYDMLCGNAEASLPYVQQFLKDLNSINGFKADDEHLKDLLAGSGEKTLQALLKETMRQIDKASIKSKSLIAAAVNGDREQFEQLYSQFNKPEHEVCMLYIIEKNKIVISQLALAEAKERYCRYIETERGLLKQQQYRDFLKAANAFFRDNPAFTGINLHNFFTLNDKLFQPVEMNFDLM